MLLPVFFVFTMHMLKSVSSILLLNPVNCSCYRAAYWALKAS